MTPQEQRIKAIYKAFKQKNFTVKELRVRLKLGTKDQFFGARVEQSLSTLASQGYLKRKNSSTYSCTDKAITKPTKPPEIKAKSDTAVGFLEELREALATSQKKQLPMGRTLAPNVERSSVDLARYGEVFIPSDAPVKPLSSRKVPTSKEEALHYFELNFSEDADTTVKELAKLVLDQKVKLEAQERVLRSMYELLRNHVYHS